MSTNDPTVNDPKSLPKPAKILTKSKGVKGMLHEYTLEDGKFSKQSVRALIRDKDNQDWILHIAVTGGDQYQQFYDIVNKHPMPIALDVSISDEYKGRTIKVLTGKAKTDISETS